MPTPRVLLVFDGAISTSVLIGILAYARLNEKWLVEIRRIVGEPHWKLPRDIDGVISFVQKAPSIPSIRRRGVAVVNLAPAASGTLNVQHVFPDDLAAGRLAAETILLTAPTKAAYYSSERGRPRLLFIPASKDARAPVKPTLDDAPASGLLTGFTSIVKSVAEPERSAEPSEVNLTRLADWLDSLAKPCAIFTPTAQDAFHLLEAARLRGIPVPKDLHILSADRDDALAALCRPTLAAIDRNAVALGQRAAQELARLMGGGDITAPVLISPAGYVPGGSMPPLTPRATLSERAVLFMLDHLADSISMPQLAQQLQVSRRTLELHFREVVGRSPAEELRRLRVERACTLLRQTSQPVQEIAMVAGFSAIELLQRAMQKQVGMTPSQYRRGAESI